MFSTLPQTKIITLATFDFSPFFTRRQILDSSKLKEFADDNFKFYENRRNFSKQVKNTVRKGEIAHYKQFLLFPECFLKACFPGDVIVWLMTLRKKTFENIESKKGQIAGNQHFLLVPYCFF